MTDASTVDQLEQRLGADWTHLRDAREKANCTTTQLREALKRFDSADTVIVVSGSLARKEFTSGSDIDWTLLVDGSADPQHYDLTAKINEIVDAIAGKPTGAEGTFSAMVFSHDLIHDIGGEDDTNRNTTRRLLLLLESAPVGREDAYTRVLRSILSRYLREDRGFWKGSQFRVPRFLQNDFARYWRTMAVDFAYKLRKRSGKGWAIRNIKLRMSRKLIYVSGLLACFQCHLDHSPKEWSKIADSPDRDEQIVNYYSQMFQQTPLEIVSGVLLRYPHLDEAAGQILGSYNEFLGILADKNKRDHLESLAEGDAETDSVYQGARQLSHSYRDGLLRLLFDPTSGMDELTKNYGVF
ncbi:MAG TPA: nucleotidyltransferase domain-containing protein [Bryobacteraceae bacterium]|nr:nucleotidyltransferase domain-containing protein [Bryobacteraceae bacterium]